MNIVKIGSVELTMQEAQKYFEENRYIVTYSKIFKIIRKGTSFAGQVVHTSKGMTRRGRFFAMTPETVKDVFNLNLA